MFCAQCQERDATVHLTQICGREVQKVDLCAECAPPISDLENGLSLARFFNPNHHLVMLSAIVHDDGRYPIDAYVFVTEALNYWQNFLAEKQAAHHASGKELLEAFRQLALEKFGVTAKKVLAEWRIFRTEDVGEIVFAMVAANLLAKRPEDSREDFREGYDFAEAFPEG
jgi:uncharacterized repeat protein (TIGR04138 family)